MVKASRRFYRNAKGRIHGKKGQFTHVNRNEKGRFTRKNRKNRK